MGVLAAWALASLLTPLPARSQASTAPAERPPTRVKTQLRDWFFKEEPDAVRLTVPIVDVDPVRGETVGVAPTWFLVSSGTTRSIHAPALSYNTVVGAAASYDYYRFPSERRQVELYGTISQVADRELFFEDTLLPTEEHPNGYLVHLQRLRDSARQFYGVGPETTQDEGTDYTLDSYNYALSYSRRLGPLVGTLGQHTEGVEIKSSPPQRFPDVDVLHPGATGSPNRHTNVALRAALALDTRDVPLAPRRGVDAEAYLGLARRNWLSEYRYVRYGGELRGFHALQEGPEPRAILAFDGRCEEVDGDVPFWLMPSLGGKRSLQSYGDGRFHDDFMASARGELRLRAGGAVLSGTPVDFWVDPFLGAGVVALDAWHVAWETIRPGYGLALRAVSRPQVVVSADFGIGQEGLKVFLDLTYTF